VQAPEDGQGTDGAGDEVGAAVFREMVNGLPLIVWVHDAAGAQQMVNDTFCEFFGVTREQMKGGRWQALMHPEDADAYAAAFVEAVARRQPFHGQTRVRRGDGEWRWLESWARPRWSRDGEFLGMVGASADITERKQSDSALAEAMRRIAEQHANLQAVYGAISDGLSVFDMQGRAVLVNEAQARMFGYPQAKYMLRERQHFLDEYRIEQLDGSALPVALWPVSRVLRGERVAGAELLVRRRGRDGYWVVSFSGEPVFDAEGRQTLAVVICRDVSERWRHDRERRANEERLRESDRRKDEYLAMLGHELRNPLAAIRNAAHLVARARGDDPLLERAADVLQRQSSHMVRLIEGLLEVSRIARGKITLEQEVVDLAAIVASVVGDRRPQLEARGLELESELPAGAVWVRGDRVRLAQILDNLVGNAIKFTPAPGRVWVALAAGEHAVVRVRDTGVGIRPESLPRVFDAFHQESQDVAREAGGLGLGLALARRLAEMHGATLEAHSAGLGQGAEFVLTLARSAPPAARRAEPASAAVRAATVESLRILVIEDNADAGDMLRQLLELDGHAVEVARDGPAALAALDRAARDIVICDIGLPGMSGYELARRMRHEGRLQGAALIALTGYGQAEDRRQAELAGFDAHLVKPLELGEFAVTLGRLGLRTRA
jgi:PAS domain S-box-containing protein